MATLRRYAKAKGKRRKSLHRKASALRRRLIAANRSHRTPARSGYSRGLPAKMPSKYRKLFAEALKSRGGRAALARYRKFTGLPWPTEIIAVKTPGRGKRALVGMGRTPQVFLARSRKDKPKTYNKGGIVACNASGRQIFVLTGRDSTSKSQKLRPVGYAAQTHYIPTRLEERAGTHKRGKRWVHNHNDEGGRWPKVYEDQAGNLIYGRGTYRVSDWIRK